MLRWLQWLCWWLSWSRVSLCIVESVWWSTFRTGIQESFRKSLGGFLGKWHSKAVLWERKLFRENGVKVLRSNIFLLLGISTGPIFHANIASRSCPSNWAISTLMRPSAIVVPTITWLSEIMGVGQWMVNKMHIKERTSHEATLDWRRIFNRWADE